MRNRILYTLFSVVVCCTYPVHLIANQKDPDSTRYLGKIEVVGQRYKDIIPAQKLSGEELERLNGLSVADAIRYFSGIQVKDYGGIGGLKTINVRGMGADHMNIYYNGIQLGNAQNGQVDLGRFSMENIEEISLYNGQKSEIFQSAREFGAAGTIYLTTRKPRFEPGKNTNLRASVRTGSYGLFNPSILYEYKISDHLSTTFNAEWTNSDGKYTFNYRRRDASGNLLYDTTAVRRNGDIDAVRIEGGLQGFHSSGFWKAYLYHYTSERGIPGAIVNNKWYNGERVWDRNSFVQGVVQQELTPDLQLKVNLKYAYDHLNYANNDVNSLKIDHTYVQKEIYFSTAAKYTLTNWWDVSTAYDYQWNGLSEFAQISRNTHWVSLATALQLANRLKMQASGLGTFVNEHSADRSVQPTRRVFTPGFFLSYQPFPEQGLVLRAFYKKSFRMPTFNDLYYNIDSEEDRLKPEKVTQYNLGTTYDFAPSGREGLLFGLSVDAYYNRVNDKIIALPKSDQQLFWAMENLNKVDIRGMDAKVYATLPVAKDWVVLTKWQYSYQRALDISSPEDNYYRHQIPYIPLHSGSAITTVSWKDWTLNYSFIYVGERHNQQENIPQNYTQPWYTSDLSLMKPVRFRQACWKFTLEVNNLFDQDYEVILNYPMPGRNFRMSAVVQL